SNRVIGLGMGDASAGIEYNNVEALSINLGVSSDTLNVQSTNSATLPTVNTGSGSATNIVNIGSLSPAVNGTVNVVAGRLVVNGQGSSDAVNVDDSGDQLANDGTLTSTLLTGLGMGADSPAKGIQYFGVETLNITLGIAGDTFTILSTHANVTVLNA